MSQNTKKSASYEEMIALFDVVQNPWKMQIFDKDGNRLISSAENGYGFVSLDCV